MSETDHRRRTVVFSYVRDGLSEGEAIRAADKWFKEREMKNVIAFPPKSGGEAGDTKPNERRWFVRIEYRSDKGGEFHQHFVEELDEIAAIVEAGPHWDTIVEISVFLNRKSEDAPDLTIEKARLL